MKRLLTTIIALLIFSFSRSPARAADTGWIIDNFHSDIVINQDTTVNVTENIKVDFFNLEKHGIYRTIPIKYSTRFGNRLDIRFDLLSVLDQQSQPIPTQTSYTQNNVKLKIGRPEVTITGKNSYQISYQIKQVITQPNELAEFYFNVTGNSWPVPIKKASATITAPEGSLLNSTCFKGSYASTTNCNHTVDQVQASFNTTNLSPRQGLTIAVELDPQKLTFPTVFQKTLLFLQDNILYSLPLGTLLFMFTLYYIKGRDKQYKNLFNQQEGHETVPLFQKITAASIYGPPKNLSPGEVGAIVDETVHMQDITAIIIDLARRGYFNIKEIKSAKKSLFKKNDFELIWKQKDQHNLQEFEKQILNMLFGLSKKSKVTLSKLPKNSYKYLTKAQNALYTHLSAEKYFASNPKNIRIAYLTIGLLIMFLSIIVGPILAALDYGSTGFISILITGIIIVAFSPAMPARTAKGRRALKQIVSLKEWVRIGAWREKIHEKHNFLEEVLPFTIAFGMTDKFIKAFKAGFILLKNVQ